MKGEKQIFLRFLRTGEKRSSRHRKKPRRMAESGIADISLAPDEISDFPLFNDLQKEIKRLFSGQCHGDAVEGVLATLEDSLESLFAHLHEQLRFQVQDTQFQSAANCIYGNFAVLQAEFRSMRRGLTDADENCVLDHLSQCRSSLAALHQTLAELKEEEQARPHFCDIPLLSDTCRVGFLVLKGELAPELLRCRLDQSWELWTNLSEVVFAEFEPGPAEVPGPLTAALMQIEEGLQALEEVWQLSDDARQSLEEAMELLSCGCATLVEFHGQLVKPPVEPSVACVRCLHSNRLGAKRCAECDALLPPQALEAGAELTLEESPAQPQWPTHVARLIAKIDRFRADQAGAAEAIQEVRDLQDRLRRGLRQITSMARDPQLAELPLEQAERLRAFHQPMAALTEHMDESLAQLIDPIRSADTLAVDLKLADLLADVEQLTELQRHIAAAVTQHRRTS